MQQEYSSLNTCRWIWLCPMFPNWTGRKAFTFLWQTHKYGWCSGNHKTTYAQDGWWEITWNHFVLLLIKPTGQSELRQSHNVQYLKNGQIMQEWSQNSYLWRLLERTALLKVTTKPTCLNWLNSDANLFRHLGYANGFLMFVYFPPLVEYILFPSHCPIFKLHYCIFILGSPANNTICSFLKKKPAQLQQVWYLEEQESLYEGK